jgi:MerR family transcriptional regulator, light-induced transcriptional regulator
MGGRIGLRDAADELGVHYMTAYRYVRSGRLPATKVGGEWVIERDDLTELLDRPARPGRVADAVPRTVHRERLEARLIAGDEPGAWGVLEAACASGATPSEVLGGLISPALASIGSRWAAGELSIADEHRASAVAHRLIARLGPRFTRPGRRRGRVVLGSAPGDQHSLPTAILSDLLRGAGLEVVDLGADCPSGSFVDAADVVGRPCVVGVCVTAPEVLATVPSLLDELRSRLPDCEVIAGGGALEPEVDMETTIERFVTLARGA